MARHLGPSIDTSDGLANLVLGVLLVSVLGLGALLVLMAAGDDAAGEPASDNEVVGSDELSEGATMTPASGAAVGDADQAEGVDGVADTVPDEQSSPLVPRGQRDDEVVPTPNPDAADTGDAAAGDDAVDTGDAAAGDDAVDTGGAVTDETSPSAPAGTGGASPDAPGVDSDDPDRVIELVTSDQPTDVRTVAVDLDGDAAPERVWAAVIRNSVHVRVQRSNADGWYTVDEAIGGLADDLVYLKVEDLTGDGRADIHTKQWVGVEGESVSLWEYRDGQLRGMNASGGCWDNTNTFGVIGAMVEPGQVLAICEALPDDPDQPSQWSTAVYRWQNGSWTFERQIDLQRER